MSPNVIGYVSEHSVDLLTINIQVHIAVIDLLIYDAFRSIISAQLFFCV